MNDTAHLVYGFLPQSRPYDEHAGNISQMISATIPFESGALQDRAVLIKADFSVRQDGRHRTDAAMLRAIAGYFVGLGATVLVGDSPLDASLDDCGAKVRERLSLEMRDLPIEFVNFEHAGATPCITDRRVF